jgi:hypothetical protein
MKPKPILADILKFFLSILWIDKKPSRANVKRFSFGIRIGFTRRKILVKPFESKCIRALFSLHSALLDTD